MLIAVCVWSVDFKLIGRLRNSDLREIAPRAEPRPRIPLSRGSLVIVPN